VCRLVTSNLDYYSDEVRGESESESVRESEGVRSEGVRLK
jgi:hypothetical protein